MSIDPFADIFAAAETIKVQDEVQVQRIADFATRSHAAQPSPGWEPPVPPATLVPHGYQAAAVETVLSYRRALLGFAPGMGKTLVAQMVAAAEVEANRVLGARILVVCPPTLRIDPWADEFRRQFPSVTVAEVTGTKAGRFPAGAQVVILPDSVLAARVEDVEQWAPTGLIFDEAQRFKTPTSKRTKALHAVARLVPADGVVLGLTGTLSTARPDDAWAPLRALGPVHARAVSGAADYRSFRDKWCITERVYGNVVKVVGCSDALGLHNALRATAYIRVEREDVLEMPDKVWAPHSLALNGALGEYRRVEKDFIAWVRTVAGDDAALRASKAEALVKLNYLRQLAGQAKVGATVEYVASLVEQDEQVVVMGWHSKALVKLLVALSAAGITNAAVVGGLSAAEKAAEVERFRSGKAQVLVGNIVAAGTGLNLDAARHLVFMELPWIPGDLIQASDRIYRVSQKRGCTIHVLNAAETVDVRQWGVLNERTRLVDAVNAGMEVTMPADSVQDEVLSSYGFG